MRPTRPRFAARHARLALAALALALLTRGAAAQAPPTSWEYPLLPHVHGLAFQPVQPVDDQITTVVLSAVYPGECWRLAGWSTNGWDQVAVTLVPGQDCSGDSVSSWVQPIALGALPAGIHPLTVVAKLAGAGPDTTYEQRTIGFEVVHSDVPPPPPPPVPPDSANATVSSILVEPAVPGPTDAVTIRLAGRFPFDCGEITAASAIGTSLAIVLGRGTCADTNHAWAHAFEVGVLPVGTTTFLLDVSAERVSGTTHEIHGIAVTVVDPNAPPPPPIDSLEAVLSKSHPNPFRDETHFAVSLGDGGPADLSVYDLSGRRVATVFRGSLPRGTSMFAWNGRRADGSMAPGGIYFYRLTLADRVVTRRVVRLGTP